MEFPKSQKIKIYLGLSLENRIDVVLHSRDEPLGQSCAESLSCNCCRRCQGISHFQLFFLQSTTLSILDNDVKNTSFLGTILYFFVSRE